MIAGKRQNQDDGNYTKVPNNILKARNLSSEAVRVLSLMIDRQSALDNGGKLLSGGTFYMVASAFDDAMDISGTQVQKKVIPELEEKGLISKFPCPSGVDSIYKRYNFYLLNWDTIYNYDGSQKDPQKEAQKKEKGKKAQETLKSRRAAQNKPQQDKEVRRRDIALRLGYRDISDMEAIDLTPPFDDNESASMVKTLTKKLALHRVGILELDYDYIFNETVELYMAWTKRRRGLSEHEVNGAIDKYMELFNGIINSVLTKNDTKD